MEKKIIKGTNSFEVFFPSSLSQGNEKKPSLVLCIYGIKISSLSHLTRVRGKGKDIIITPKVDTIGKFDTEYFYEIPQESAMIMYQALSGRDIPSAMEFLYGDSSPIASLSKEEFSIDERIPQ